MHEQLTIGLAQMASVVERDENLQLVDSLMSQAQGCDMLVFPEYVLSLAGDASVRRAARSLADTHAELGALARKHGLTVVFGGVPVLDSESSPLGLRNAALTYDAAGQPLARYDKIHLFQMGESAYDETGLFDHGTAPCVVDVHGWRCALSICYDVRFPELYRRLGLFDILLCPAAFTRVSGEAHWHILLRARAIENQCYVVAPDQCGNNSEVRVPKYGHCYAGRRARCHGPAYGGIAA